MMNCCDNVKACFLLLLLSTQTSALIKTTRFSSATSSVQGISSLQGIRRFSAALQCASSVVSDEKTRKFLDWADTEGSSVFSIPALPVISRNACKL